jgi:hypothetical protein
VCGNFACEAGETCSNCQQDCGPCGDTNHNCCIQKTVPGCNNSTIQQCVCAADPYCCSTAWDGICVGEVEDLGCGKCPAP